MSVTFFSEWPVFAVKLWFRLRAWQILDIISLEENYSTFCLINSEPRVEMKITEVVNTSKSLDFIPLI